jgi:hypothetical protein
MISHGQEPGRNLAVVIWVRISHKVTCSFQARAAVSQDFIENPLPNPFI